MSPTDYYEFETALVDLIQSGKVTTYQEAFNFTVKTYPLFSASLDMHLRIYHTHGLIKYFPDSGLVCNPNAKFVQLTLPGINFGVGHVYSLR
jgi:hypothetical protein